MGERGKNGMERVGENAEEFGDMFCRFCWRGWRVTGVKGCVGKKAVARSTCTSAKLDSEEFALTIFLCACCCCSIN